MKEREGKGFSLFHKIFSGYVLSVVIIAVISVIIVSSAREFSANANKAHAEILPNTLKAKDL